MVNYEYRDLVNELLKGQDLIRETCENQEPVNTIKLSRTFKAINFYSTHKNNFSPKQREGLDLLVQGISNLCSAGCKK